MPINPSIAGSAITQQEPIDLLGSLGKVAAIKHYQAQAAEQQRKQQKAQQIEALASQYPDPEDFIAAAHKIDPMFAAEFGKRHEEAKTAKLKTYQEGLAAEGKTVDRYLRLLQASDDDPKAYGIVRQGLVQASQDYDAVLPTPEQWADPTVRARVFSMGDTIANSLKTKQATTEAFLKGDYRRGLAEAVSGAPNLQVARSYLEEARGVAPKGDIQYVENILASMPDFPSAQQVLKQGALTADQQRQGEQAAVDDKRQSEQFGETKRHNQATEAAARATNARLVAAANGEGGGLKPGDAQTVEAIIKNPGLYAGLTPSTKERLIPALMEKGFTGFASGQAGKPSTGLQKKALGYFTRAKQAAEEIELLQESGMGLAGQTYAEWAPNFAQTQSGQAYNAAQRAFTEARLRKDSGAAIPQQEFDSDRNTYFRKPGDSDATLAQKKRGRAAMLAALAFEAGPALHEFYGEDADQMLTSYKAAQRIGGDVKNASVRNVGDEVMVNGQKVKITKVLANGQFEGDVVR